MATWPVFVQFWQLECCGDPFATGQEVAWTLVLVDATNNDRRWPDPLLVDVDAVLGDPAMTDDGQDGFLVVLEGMTAWWPGDRPNSERLALRGLLREEHHGGVPHDMPTVRGRVQRIRLVGEPCRRVRANEWEPTSGTWELEVIPRSPNRFRHGQAQRDVVLNETGLLVDLLPV
jgi:Family of unknown function (DUF6578)